MEMNKTGLLIEQQRREKNMTQAELADAVGVSKQAVSNWERGKRFPDVSLIEDIAAALGLSVAEIIKGERIEEAAVSKDEAAQLVFEALRVQKNELRRRWTIVSIMCAALTAMACLGWRYAFFYDKLILLNFGTWDVLELLLAAAFGCVIRRFSAAGTNFICVPRGNGYMDSLRGLRRDRLPERRFCRYFRPCDRRGGSCVVHPLRPRRSVDNARSDANP